MGLNEIIKLGDNIRKLRLKKGLSQKEMAKRVGIAYSTYSNYENNNRVPNIDTLFSIAEALGVSENTLLGIDDSTAYKSNIHLEDDGSIIIVPIEVNENEATLIKFYRDLTELGKERVMNYVIDLWGNNFYNRNKQ